MRLIWACRCIKHSRCADAIADQGKAFKAMREALRVVVDEWEARVGSVADNTKYRPEWINQARAALALANAISGDAAATKGR